MRARALCPPPPERAWRPLPHGCLSSDTGAVSEQAASCDHVLVLTFSAGHTVKVAVASRVRVAPEAGTGPGWLYRPEQGNGLGA